MKELIEMLYAFNDVKALNYSGQTHDVLDLVVRINDKAQTVRERVLRYAIRSLVSDNIGIDASFVIVRVQSEPASSVLDRPDVKALLS